MKRLLTTTLLVATLGLNVQAAPSPEYDVFMQADNASELSIAYTDLDQFLDMSVYDVGPSTREKADKQSGTTGTRMRNKINRLTALEGNRFYFDNFDNEKYVEVLNDLQQSLESLPNEVPLSSFNRNEQLAYWLNLYNFTLLKEMASEHPGLDMRRLTGDDDDSLRNRKVVTISGVPLSLNDIHFKILKEKYHSDPVVIYGLFQGVIGGPSIQTEAFTGEKVWRQLERIAKDFVNSNRGTYYDGRLSDYYERNLVFFDNDMQKLKDHVLDYLNDDVYQDIVATDADDLDLDIRDINLAGVGGGRDFGAGLMTNNAAMIDAARVEQRGLNAGGGGAMGNGAVQNFVAEGLIQKAKLNVRFSPDEISVLKGLRDQHDVAAGKVRVTDLSEDEAKKKEKQKQDQ
ncbi:DUF547 domain-containing protein [Alteromonas sp. CYL-A6]|uniref:DUF547 domain-containing protein n=1 Tax=Alteromonas nitratireducens TaxID=3390813 RepID=UPI0034C33907